MYSAMVKREAVKSIEAQKHQMIAALYANSAFEETEKALKQREERIKGLEQHFNKAIEMVYHPELHQVQDIDWNNPFWAAAQRAKEQRMAKFRGEDPESTVGEVVAAHGTDGVSGVISPADRGYDQV